MKGLILVDPNPFSYEQIDLILGADKYGLFSLPALRQGVSASNKIETSISLTAHQIITAEVLHEDLTRFREVEEIPVKDYLTEDEKFCNEHVATNHQPTKDGRYMIRLPFKDGPPMQIEASLERKKIVLNKVLRRLSGNSELLSENSSFLVEYKRLGNMKLIPEQTLDRSSETVFASPPCFKRKYYRFTTKMRVVSNHHELKIESFCVYDQNKKNV